MRVTGSVVALALLLAVPHTASGESTETSPFACRKIDETGSAKPPTLFDRLAACHFYLRSTIYDDSQGASFAFGHDGAQHTNGFKTQFAAGYRSAPLGMIGNDPAPFLLLGVDGNLATGSQSSKRSSYLNVRPELGWRLTRSSGPDPAQDKITEIYGLFLRFGPMLEASQDFAIRNALGEVAATFTYDAAGGPVIGKYVPLGGSGIEYRFRPYAIVQAGSNLHGRLLSGELNTTRLRLIPQGILEFQLGQPEELGITSAVLQLVDTYTVEPLEGRTVLIKHKAVTSANTHNLFATSLQFGVAPGVTFGPTYATGSIAPTFKRDTTVTVTLKIGFGVAGAEAGPIKSSF
jgi:hypothetical protein